MKKIKTFSIQVGDIICFEIPKKEGLLQLGGYGINNKELHIWTLALDQCLDWVYFGVSFCNFHGLTWTTCQLAQCF